MKPITLCLSGSLVVLCIFVGYNAHKNEQGRGHPVDSEYRDSLTAQILADSDTIKYVQDKMHAGTMDATNGMMAITNLQARDLHMQQLADEFDRTNK